MGEGEKGVRRALTYNDKLVIERGLTWCALKQNASPQIELWRERVPEVQRTFWR